MFRTVSVLCAGASHTAKCLLCPAGSAQEPIGAPAACSAGQTDLVLCYIDSSGYLADVQYSNTMRNTPVSACGTQQWQLESSQLQSIQLSGSDSILRFRACGDAGGLRGLVFRTSLGAELSCGSPQGSSSCRSFSSRSTYPLRGFSATCANLNPGQHTLRNQGLVTRVSSIKAACWTPARQTAAQGEQGGALVQYGHTGSLLHAARPCGCAAAVCQQQGDIAEGSRLQSCWT
jgi:hypothetical protein